MNKRAIVLAGGGPKGAFELGAWKALRELGVEFGAVYGTSIGAFNAALMVQGDFELARELWENITPAQVVAGVDAELRLEELVSRRQDLVPFLRRYVNHRGMDNAPFKELASRVISEQRVRAAGIGLGVVTVKYPSLTPVEITLDQMPEGRLIDYLMASSACFPAFPVYRIGGTGYIDGGYYETLPIDFALRNGAEEIVAVDLFDRPMHAHHQRKPFVTYIKPSWPLAGYFNLEQVALRRSAQMGYMETMKAYGKLDGIRYTFESESDPARERMEKEFALELSRQEGRLAFHNSITKDIAGTPISSALDVALCGRSPTHHNLYLAGRELCAELFELEPVEVYSIGCFHRALLERMPDSAEMLPDSLISMDSVRKMIGSAKRSERVTLVAQVYGRLRHDGQLADRWLRVMSMMPREVIAAYYLRASLEG